MASGLSQSCKLGGVWFAWVSFVSPHAWLDEAGEKRERSWGWQHRLLSSIDMQFCNFALLHSMYSSSGFSSSHPRGYGGIAHQESRPTWNERIEKLGEVLCSLLAPMLHHFHDPHLTFKCSGHAIAMLPLCSDFDQSMLRDTSLTRMVHHQVSDVRSPSWKVL